MSKQIPHIVYKYRNCSKYSIENLKNNVVWCSTLDNYNDPYEGYTTVSFLQYYKAFLNIKTNNHYKTQIDLIKNDDELVDFVVKEKIGSYKNVKEACEQHKKFLQESHKKQRDNNIQNTAMCSFSEDNNNGLMWAHYSDSHKGFCISYDTDQMQNNLYKVKYKKSIFNITDELIKILQLGKKYKPNQNLPSQMCIQKDIIWKYEKEWRLIFSGIDIDPEFRFDKQKMEELKNKKGFLYKLIPKAVYLGTKIEEHNEREILQIAREQKLNAYKMEMDDDNYILLPKIIF